MLRFILISIALLLTTLVFGQNKEIAFVDKNQLEWLDGEVAELNAAVALLEEGRANADRSTVNGASRKIKRSLMTLTSTGVRMYEGIATYLDPAYLAKKDEPIVGDMAETSYQRQININRGVRNLEEMRLTSEEVDGFLENMAAIKDLSDILAVHNYDFNCKELRNFEISDVRTALDAANANNLLLTGNTIN